MFRFLLKTSLLGVLATGALYATGTTDKVVHMFEHGKKKVAEKINELQGMSAQLNRIESKVSQLDTEILELKQAAVRDQIEVERLESDIDERQGGLDKLKGSLERAHSLLETEEEYFRIGSATYSRDEVERDVAEKIALYKVQDETLAHLRQTYVTHRNAKTIAQENVRRGQAVKIDLESKIRLLRAKLERYKAREIYAETVAVDFDAEDFNTGIGEARQLFARFDKDLEVKNRLLDERMRINATSGSVTGIDYDAEEAPSPTSVQEKLSLFLGYQTAPTSPVTALATDNQ